MQGVYNILYHFSEPPTIVIKPSDTTALYGTTVLLTCAAFGNEPVILWLKDSQPIPSPTNVYNDVFTVSGVNYTHSILELCSVTFKLEGTYSCVANDSIGSVTSNFTLTVYTDGK